jgi:Protein of unknown function (DUF1566)
MKTPLALPDFLNLSIGHATDAYLRELALVAIQSRHLAHTVEQLSAYKSSLTEAEAPKGKLIEGSYLVADDGTVTDQQTGLMWMQSALEGTFTFEAAQQAAKNLNAQKGFAGHTDWRIPNQDELLSLVVGVNCPSICQEAFPDTPEASFWTSTPHAENSVGALIIHFGNGRLYSNNRHCYFNHVRLVR